LELGIYTDGDEEAVLVEDVTIEVIIGNENKQLSSDKVGMVYVMKPHNFCDIRSNKAKVIIILAYTNIIIRR
jgi:hypothetical protein